MTKEKLVVNECIRFQNAVKDIIDEQKNQTLKLAYQQLRDCYNANISSLLGETHD